MFSVVGGVYFRALNGCNSYHEAIASGFGGEEGGFMLIESPTGVNFQGQWSSLGIY